jgi:hypothetical protein
VQYKNSVRRGSKYLNNLSYIICVYKGTINLVIEHLKILLVLIDRLSLPLLPFLHHIILIDLVEEQHYPPLVTIILKDSCTLKPNIIIVIVSVSY